MMFDKMRDAMVDSQLRTTGVNDPDVLAAIRVVARERFVPAARGPQAYSDLAITVAPGRALLEPMVFGLLLTHARIVYGERVLVVGAATGYAATVIGRLTPHVTALEEDATLATTARANGVTVVEGPLAAGWADAALYDVIYLEGAAAALPPGLLAQVVEGGRVAAVMIGDDGVARATVGRVAAGQFAGSGFIETGATVLPGFGRQPKFVF